MTHAHALQTPQHDQAMSQELAESAAAAAAAASHTSPTSTELTATNDAGQSDPAAPVADSTLPATREADVNSQQSCQPSAGTLLAVSQDEQQDACQPVLNSSSVPANVQLKGDSISRTGSLDRQLSGITTGLTQPGDVAAATTSVVRDASLPPASQHAVLHSQAEHADVESGSKGGGTHVVAASELPDEQGSSASRTCQQERDQRCQELEQQSR